MFKTSVVFYKHPLQYYNINTVHIVVLYYNMKTKIK